MKPLAHLFEAGAHKGLPEERAHAGADNNWLEWVDAASKQDETSTPNCCGCPDERAEVAWRSHLREHHPTGAIAGCDTCEILNVLTQNGTYPGGSLGARDRTKLLRRYAGKRHARALQSPHELARDRRCEQPLAVEHCLYSTAMIHGSDEITHAFDEETTLGIAIAAIALEPRNMREGWRKRKRALARCFFTDHAPGGEPSGSRKVCLLSLVEGSGAARYSRGERTCWALIRLPNEGGVTCNQYTTS
jgi:hypothetical protein